MRLAVYLLLLIAAVVLGRGWWGGWKNLAGTAVFQFNFMDQGLSRIVNSSLPAEGTYAVYIENLNSGEKYSLHEQEIFPAASLYKLFLVAAVLEEVDSGKLTLESEVSASKEYLTNKFGGVDFGYEQAPDQISYSVEEAMQRVGRVSDNFAAIMLSDKVGVNKLQLLAERLGTTATSLKEPPSTTASDIALFFRKLYKDEVVSASVSAKITEVLSLNQLNNRIPAKLPKEVKIVHKTGELSRVRHDAGIVYLASQGDALRAYVIVLLSKDLKYEDEGVETLAQISKEVYEYFEGGPTGN